MFPKDIYVYERPYGLFVVFEYGSVGETHKVADKAEAMALIGSKVSQPKSFEEYLIW